MGKDEQITVEWCLDVTYQCVLDGFYFKPLKRRTDWSSVALTADIGNFSVSGTARRAGDKVRKGLCFSWRRRGKNEVEVLQHFD